MVGAVGAVVVQCDFDGGAGGGVAGDGEAGLEFGVADDVGAGHLIDVLRQGIAAGGGAVVAGDGGGLDGDIKSGAAAAGVGGAVEGDGGEAVGAVAQGRWGVAPGGLAGGEGGVAEVGFAFVDADFAGADAGGDGAGEGVMASLVPLRCEPERAGGWGGWGC